MRRNELLALLEEHGLALSRQRGQNFLLGEGVCEKIAAQVQAGPGDTVVELGTGLGALTRQLAAHAGRVISIEIDRGIVELNLARSLLPANVELRHQDMLKQSFEELARETGGRLIIAGNLPYSISTPLLVRLVQAAGVIDRAVFMLQKETGARLLARPGSKAYGGPTVLLGAAAQVETLFPVGPEHFFPRPKVDSVVLSFRFQPQAPLDRPQSPAALLFFSLVRTAFQGRRKTLVNALAALPLLSPDASTTGPWPRRLLADAILEAEIAASRRPDQISVGEYRKLAVILAERLHGRGTAYSSCGEKGASTRG